jgi:hypothetical protein
MLNFKLLKKVYVLSFLVYIIVFSLSVRAGTLSCSVTTTCPSGVIAYRMSSTTNAHTELGTQTNYPNMICCTGVSGLSNSCSGTFDTTLKLSSTTNAHVEKNTFSNFTQNACLSVPTGGSVTVGYQSSNCNGYDTTLGSIQNDTNSHVGSPNSYNNKICASANSPQSITFSISDNTIGFGQLLSTASRYATGDIIGSLTDTTHAHTITAGTNAVDGYTISIQGNTLTSGGNTIDAIGSSATPSNIGIKQFGVRATVNSGTGTVSPPYNTSNWALDTVSFPDIVLNGIGDGISSDFGMRYLSNINASAPSGSYSAVLTYTITSNF